MIYSLYGFSVGHHWDAAYIEADSAEEAKQILAGLLKQDIETVWEVTPEEKWTVVETGRPLRYVLGSGCR